jgi:hypothetical protein
LLFTILNGVFRLGDLFLTNFDPLGDLNLFFSSQKGEPPDFLEVRMNGIILMPLFKAKISLGPGAILLSKIRLLILLFSIRNRPPASI